MFSFLWASQALVHQEFFSGWLKHGDWAGWLTTGCAVALLLFPSRSWLLGALALCSLIHNVGRWPFVANHILVEALINAGLLVALGHRMVIRRRATPTALGSPQSPLFRDAWFAAFAPVVRMMLVVVYYFAFLAKLNADFVNPEVSCVSVMYDDLAARLRILPVGRAFEWIAIGSTLVIEASIPILFSFRATRASALTLGLVFHLMLGSIGHRTFSALAFALYSLFLSDELGVLVTRAWDRFRARWQQRYGAIVNTTRVLTLAVTALLVALKATDPHAAFVVRWVSVRVPQLAWGLWSLVVIALYFTAIGWRLRGLAPGPEAAQAARTRAQTPRFMYALVALVMINGLSQYAGLKTESALTMYSNLRTEGGVNNHYFMPALRLANFQDDLVEILETDHPHLSEHVTNGELITFFELRRAAARAKHAFTLKYRRNGEPPTEVDDPVQEASLEPPSTWMSKLLAFRPIDKHGPVQCRH